jgi:hypothetical protein
MEISVYNKNIDFFRKREEKESNLKEALINLEEFKKRTPESVYPQDIYGSVMNPKIMYASEYTRLLETAVRAKTTLEIMDLVLEGLMRERISILEDILKS